MVSRLARGPGPLLWKLLSADFRLGQRSPSPVLTCLSLLFSEDQLFLAILNVGAPSSRHERCSALSGAFSGIPRATRHMSCTMALEGLG